MKQVIKPHCTVVLCTYNGAAFLGAQLDSLLAQTRQPDRLVVGDDGSTDATLDIFAAFRQSAPFPVEIHVTEKPPIGPAANFARTLAKSSGDWFALCDQDDIWHSNKLEQLEAALMGDERVMLAFSDARLVNADLTPLDTTLWQRVGIDSKILKRIAQNNALSVFLKRYRVMGAAMAFRADLLPLVLPLPHGWPHDAWIATIAAATGHIAALPKSLLDYRQHQNNAVGGRRPPWLKLLRDGICSDRKIYLDTEITRYRLLLERLESLDDLNGKYLPRSRQLVRAKLSHLERRAAMPDMPFARWPAVLGDWHAGEYRKWTTDWRSLLLDLFLPNRDKPSPRQTEYNQEQKLSTSRSIPLRPTVTENDTPPDAENH